MTRVEKLKRRARLQRQSGLHRKAARTLALAVKIKEDEKRREVEAAIRALEAQARGEV